MSLHNRYLQQAAWTRGIRSYLFDQVGSQSARRILEVGCGTGAILMDCPAAGSSLTRASPLVFGIDLDGRALAECSRNAPQAILTRADGGALPFPDRAFDVSFCHFLLLWVKDPLGALREMKRVTSRSVLALAEPDFSQRVDLPEELIPLGRMQAQALAAQGADVSIGARLAELFHQAGIEIIETGPIASWSRDTFTAADLQSEWNTLEFDLAQTVPKSELRRLRILDQRAQQRGQRVLHVPTYFAWGQV